MACAGIANPIDISSINAKFDRLMLLVLLLLPHYHIVPKSRVSLDCSLLHEERVFADPDVAAYGLNHMDTTGGDKMIERFIFDA
jgi:hypothetical protein